MKLCIGMAVYDDYDGPWFSLMALRMYHQDVAHDVEYVVIDNCPQSDNGTRLAGEIHSWMPDVRYVAMPEPTGTSAPRNRIFEEASQESMVVCMDSHVLLDVGGLQAFMDWYEATTSVRDDLFTGPMVYPNLETYSTHMTDTWGAGMWGQWASSPAGKLKRHTIRNGDTVSVGVDCGPPFEINAMGLGLFAARKDSWLGFNPKFKDFGGEEFYIHTKYRQHGRKCWSIPQLRWMHRFNQTVAYPASIESRLHNYVIGLTELGLPLEPAINHFTGFMEEIVVERIIQEALDRDDKLERLREERRRIDMEISVCEGA